MYISTNATSVLKQSTPWLELDPCSIYFLYQYKSTNTDTKRVSLTEDPWLELDPCKKLKAIADTQVPVKQVLFYYQSCMY
jgi:hypothetical protein